MAYDALWLQYTLAPCEAVDITRHAGPAADGQAWHSEYAFIQAQELNTFAMFPKNYTSRLNVP